MEGEAHGRSRLCHRINWPGPLCPPYQISEHVLMSKTYWPMLLKCHCHSQGLGVMTNRAQCISAHSSPQGAVTKRLTAIASSAPP